MRLYVSCLLVALVTALLIPISAGAQESADCAAVFDSTGARIARVQHYEDPYVIAFLNHNGNLVPIRAGHGRISGFQEQKLFYTEPDCVSDSFIVHAPSSRFMYSRRVGSSIVYADPNGVSEDVGYQSINDVIHGCLTTIGIAHGVVSTLQFTLPTFTSPFKVKPEPCFTPPDPDPEQIINACVKNKSGTLRIVADPADCTPRETPISWVGQ